MPKGLALLLPLRGNVKGASLPFGGGLYMPKGAALPFGARLPPLRGSFGAPLGQLKSNERQYIDALWAAFLSYWLRQ